MFFVIPTSDHKVGVKGLVSIMVKEGLIKL